VKALQAEELIFRYKRKVGFPSWVEKFIQMTLLI
jgi:hypothetical protein